MKWILSLVFVCSLGGAFSQDTLYCQLPTDFYRQYVLHADSTFTFSYKLQQGKGYSKGTYTKEEDVYTFTYNTDFTPHKVEQSKRENVDSVRIKCNTKHEIFLNLDSNIYRGYGVMTVPIPKSGKILFQVNNEVIWLNNLTDGNDISIEIVSQGDDYYASNLISEQLTEYRNNFLETTSRFMYFASKKRDIGHRMKKVDYIRLK